MKDVNWHLQLILLSAVALAHASGNEVGSLAVVWAAASVGERS
jgi:hypothetical protein